MPEYTFHCTNKKCDKEFDQYLSFAQFDQLKNNKISVSCDCGSDTELLIGENITVYDATPRTLGTLAERNAKFRVPQVEEEEEIKREKKRAEGKWVPPKEVSTWWEKPERPKVDMKERKAVKEEHIAKTKRKKK